MTMGPQYGSYNTREVQKACMRWLKRNSVNGQDLYAFAQFLGFPHKGGHHLVVDTENPEVRRLIDLINGPNGDAILKMLEIRNNDKANGNK